MPILKKTIPTWIGAVILFVVVTGAFIGGTWWYKNSQTSPTPKKETGLDETPSPYTFSFMKTQYKRKVTLPKIGNDKSLTDFQVFIKLNTETPIQEKKLALDCSNIYFTDAIGKKIPFWMGDNECYQKESGFWLNIPNVAPNEEKTLYVYYGNEIIPTESNFEKVFPQQSTPGTLIASYFFGPFVWGNDTSGYDKKIEKSYSKQTMDYDLAEAPTFNHWGCGKEHPEDDWFSPCTEADFSAVNFTAPTSPAVDMSQGTIEMWLTPYVSASENYQKIIFDSGGNIELGIQPSGDLYFYPSQAGSKNYNLVNDPFLKDTDPYSGNEQVHLVVTWDFASKKSNFYINGKKRANDIENIPTNWTEKPHMGATWNIGGFAYAGEIDGLRIYSKVLSDKEIGDAYVNNSPTVREPKIVVGDEELISREGEKTVFFGGSFAIENIPQTEKITLSAPYYATPLDDRWGFRSNNGEYDGPLYQGKPVYLLSKSEAYPDNFVFGYPSHFDAHAGTSIGISGSFLLTHVGLKISDPSLIKDMRIELGSGGTFDERGSTEESKGLLSYLVTNAYACGGGSYYTIGKSELEFVEKRSGIFWYVLKTPVLASNAGSIQMYYIPSGKEGFLSIALKDLIFQDQAGSFVRPQISSTGYNFCGEYDDPKEKTKCYSDEENRSYRAYIAPEENGNVTFSQNGENVGVLMTFENNGKDAFTLDKNSFETIKKVLSRNSQVEAVNIRNKDGGILYTYPIAAIENGLIGKTIAVSSSISTPLEFDGFENNMTYWITLSKKKTDESAANSLDSEQRRVIHWTFGKNPYFYAPQAWGDNVLYKVDIDGQGITSFTKPNQKDLPK